MSIFPVRGLAEKGVLTDPSPYQLDLNAWSRAMNVQFHANSALTAPIFRVVLGGLSQPPVYCFPRRLASTATDQLVVACADASLLLYGYGATTSVNPSGFSSGTDPRAFTGAMLGDVVYINRPDRAPVYLGPSASAFAPLPGWGVVGGTAQTWTCRSLRAFGDYLLALGMTINGVYYGNLISWSDLTLNGQPPGSWDYTNQSTNAGQNPLEQTTTPIVDGAPMRGIFVVYTETEVWAIQQTGTQSIFQFYQLFSDGGMIAPNCCAEVLGKHYVFGPDDIYVHDGVQRLSIIDKRNKAKVFDYLNPLSTESCFVHYNPVLKTVTFGYSSGDPDAQFPVSTSDSRVSIRCNMGAVYDIVADTWSFIDLPNVGAIVQVFDTNTLTYATTGGLTYSTMGGSYYNQDSGLIPLTAAVSAKTIFGGITLPGQPPQVTDHRILGYDYYSTGKLSYPYLAEVNGPPFLERTGIDLDQLGADLASVKVMRSLLPLVKVTNSGDVVYVQVGTAMFEGQPLTWSPTQTFDPTQNYKLDFNAAARYLGVRFTAPVPQDFGVSGFDVDLTTGGRR